MSAVADGPMLMTEQLRAQLKQWGLHGGQGGYKVHPGSQTGMLLKLYNIDCDVIRTGCWNSNKQPFSSSYFRYSCWSNCTLILLCAFTHIHHSIFSSFDINCTFKMGFIVLCLLCGSMYTYCSYPSSKPACAVISAEPAQYKGEVFIGTILHLLEATDS